MGACKSDNFKDFLDGVIQRNYIAKNRPVQLLLGLTNVCNLHCAFCPYCGFCSAKIEMANMLPVELVEALRPYLEAAQFVNPSGRGEPLLYRHFEEFIEVCRECDALGSMQLTNNGTQLQRYDLAKMEGINIIAISIDSVDARTFELLRYGAKLEQVLDNVKRLRKALPNTVLQWCVVVNRLNIRQLSDIYTAARGLGIDYITFNDVYGYEDDKVIQLLRLRESDRGIVDEQFEKIGFLNSDRKLVVNNVISWSGYEDGEALNEADIFSALEKLKDIEPYLNFDALNCNDTESRRIKTEVKKDIAKGEIRLPYCTNPFEVMFIQPDGTVSPCCASFGAIDKIEGIDLGGAWNGKNYQLLREAMFNWDMLPDYCRKCEAFMRYDYVDDFWNALKARNDGSIPDGEVVIPPNYFPPEGAIKSEDLMALIRDCHEQRSNKGLADRKRNLDDFLNNMLEQNVIVSNNPVQVLIGLTNVCNLHCSFCLYCGFCMKKIEKPEMLPWEALEKLRGYLETVDILIPSGRGEPLVYDRFADFMHLCRETGAVKKMQLVNNGTLLDRYSPEVFQGLNILSVSFDSTSKDIFELLRYGSDYERILDNIKYIRNALPDLVMQLSVTVNRLNMEEMSDIYSLARDMGINYISYNSLYGSEEDKVIQLLRLRNSDRPIVEEQLGKIRQLNVDRKIEIINVITWPQPEDEAAYDKQDLLSRLSELKDITPYLDYDELNMYDTSTRAMHEEARKDTSDRHKETALPYCTNPYCVFMLQPDENVSPCCGAFGAISNLRDRDAAAVWNGKEYQLLREAMFQYDMLPDYCRNCRSFIRYDYINEYIDMLKVQNRLNYDTLVIPPNYFPPEGLIRDERVQRKIEEQQKNNEILPEGKHMDMNSQEYWNARYASKDWQKYGGSEQTQFFANTMKALLPEWLIHEINENAYDVCDLGCAEGDSLKIYRTFLGTSELSGEDFSENAIQTARNRYPEFSYKVSDIMQSELEQKYPVVICSNVVEHFRDTYKVLCKICERSTKYTIIMIPYREEPGAIDEHVQTFHTENIPLCVEGNYLVYAKNILCDSIYYPYEQILLVYAKDVRYAVMSDIVENVESSSMADVLRRIKVEYEEKVESELRKADAEHKEELENELRKANAEHKKELENELRKADAEHKEELKKELQKVKAAQREEIDKELKKAETEYGKAIEKLTQQLDYTTKEVRVVPAGNAERTGRIEELIQQLNDTQNKQNKAYAVLQQKNEYIMQAQELCNQFATGKLMKLNHFLFRVKGQLLKGRKVDRKEFWAWLRGRIRHTNRSLGAGITYNPLMVINRKLQEAVACHPSIEAPLEDMGKEDFPVQNSDALPMISDTLRKELEKDYTKYDVIILSVIDYSFRHQRPQHFATRFAANGHRVFYVNANFIRPDSVSKERENLFVVDFSNNQYNAIYAMDGHMMLSWMQKKFDNLLFEQGIRDAIIIVDYPNWVVGAKYLRERYGFKIVSDYMDDYTGFLGTAEEFLKDNCIHLLQCSDMVVASSQFLFEVAARYTEKEKIEVVRNGTEVEHFYQAIHLESPDKSRSVIGYYGAVAHWFAWEKVCCLARKFPECDIVIVGDVTEHRTQLEQYSNIKLLGEKPYKDLPQYLADFDVCLIPFDTSTDLIKATNPVKFYEYLSAGKKIVATEIPELIPYRDKYVYMSNEDDIFADYVKLCLEGKDCLKGKEECIAFARENDWQKRYEVFEESCTRHIPKVSIVVLTYNNLVLNKQCIDSILQKTAYGNYELIIVDNASTDGTTEYLKGLQNQDKPAIKIILNTENKGFAGGNNDGIEAAVGDYILLLNNDTLISRGWLTALVKHLENYPVYGMCNPVTNSIGNESMIRVQYTGKQEMLEYAYVYTASHMNQEYTDVDRLPLFATIIRKNVIDEIGMLDDSYKIGMFEDDDYTERVKNAGYKIIVAEDAFVHHINNGSFKKLSDDEYHKIFAANKATFESKWGRKWTMPKYREGVTADCNANCNI